MVMQHGTRSDGGPSALTAWLRTYLPVPRLILLAALIISFLVTRWTPATLDLAPTMRPIWLSVVAGGLALVAWALWTLDVGMLGGVTPTAPRLVVAGPYRFLRHPVYVGMVISVLAHPLAEASLPGLLAALLFVIPAVVYRAGREEAALARRFGAEWDAYRRRTPGWIPRLSRNA
jgi:protein-S-isoprenylcysteine O-methyltransferase Ste14